MFKRLLLAVALSASLFACTPAGTSSPATTVEPSFAAPSGAAPSDAAPSGSMPAGSAAPSAS